MQKLVRWLLLSFANLAMLPGCQHFFPQNNGVQEDARVRRDLVAAKETVSGQPAPIKDGKGISPPVEPKKDVAPASPPRPIAPPDPKWIDPAAEPLKGPRLDLSKTLKPSDRGLPGFVVAAQGNAPPQPLPQIPLIEEKPLKRSYACVEALRLILEGQQPKAIQHLEAYDKETQEFFLRYLPILTVFANKRFDELDPREIGVLNDQLSGLGDMLRRRSELGINRMCFCREIRAYGYYVPLSDKHAFLAGSKDRLGELVQLYVELKNFASEATPDAEFLTKLACTLELRDGKGEKVWSHTYDRNLTTYPRKTRLNDFYSNYRFYVPALPPGDYQLAIHIADETNPELRREVRKSLDFRVTPLAGQPALR